MSAPRTISIGSATFDLFAQTNKEPDHLPGGEAFVLPLGHKIWITGMKGYYGGGAANTSVGLARLGCNASYCGIISDDQWGRQILENFKKEKVDTDSATIVEGESSSFSIILSSPTGERMILAHQGTTKHLGDVTFDRETVASRDWVYLNHIHSDSSVIEDDIIAILTTHDKTGITWNPGGGQIESGLRVQNNRTLVAHTTLLVLNKEEALAFTGKPTQEEALRTLIEAGAKHVCISDGKNGCIASDGKLAYRCPALDGKVVDTTGAGDAFGTGMTWALSTGKDLPFALKAGTINAMSVVGAVGAQPGLLTDTEIRTRLEDIDIHIETFPL